MVGTDEPRNFLKITPPRLACLTLSQRVTHTAYHDKNLIFSDWHAWQTIDSNKILECNVTGNNIIFAAKPHI